MARHTLKSIIKESVYSALDDTYDKWEEALDRLGCDTMLDAIKNYLSTDEMRDILDDLNRDYDLFDDEEDEDYD